jgi:hypothetical protein
MQLPPEQPPPQLEHLQAGAGAKPQPPVTHELFYGEPPIANGSDHDQVADQAPELPRRDPRLTQIMDRTRRALHAISPDNPEAKLSAVYTAARDLERIGDDGSDPIGELSNLAIQGYGLDADDVQDALIRGGAAAWEERTRKQDREEPLLSAGDDFLAYWHGEVIVEESRPWCAHGTIPEVGCGLFSGQWGTYKTFAVIDLAAALMTGTAIFGSEIDRRGGVLFYAAEGENEVAIRFQAAIENRCRGMEKPPVDPARAPFAWLTSEKLPLNLLDPESVERFADRAMKISAEMQERFKVPLVAVFVDTVVATAGYRRAGDENDPVLNARIMRDGLGFVARKLRIFAAGVDHFGKEADVGTRGSSAKEDNSDFVLAALGTKTLTGIVSNPRIAVRKVRGGVAGREYPFSTRIATVGNDTTLVIDWVGQKNLGAPSTNDAWGKGQGVATLRRALLNADIETATEMQPWPGGPKVKAFRADDIKREFYASYPAKGDTPEDRKEATRKAWSTAVGGGEPAEPDRIPHHRQYRVDLACSQDTHPV